MRGEGPEGAGRRALVVFTDENDVPWLRFLASGFRHCFVMLWDSRGWLVVDSMAHRLDLRLLPAAPGFDMAAFFREQGYRVLAVRTRPAPRRLLPPSPFTCVETAKRVLGLRAPWVLTPKQLHRHLKR